MNYKSQMQITLSVAMAQEYSSGKFVGAVEVIGAKDGKIITKKVAMQPEDFERLMDFLVPLIGEDIKFKQLGG